MQIKSYLFIGGGVFGAAGALELLRRDRRAVVTVLVRDTNGDKTAASHDLNKIIRVEYDDPLWVKLALRCQAAWRNDPFYSRFHRHEHQVLFDDSGYPERVLALFGRLGLEPPGRLVATEDIRQDYDHIFTHTDAAEQAQAYLTTTSGWVDANGAMAAVIAEAKSLGARIVNGEVTRLLFNDSNDCIGAHMADGRNIYAAYTILAAGAGAVEILAESCTPDHPFVLQDRFIAAGVVRGTIELEEKQLDLFHRTPIFVRDLGSPQGRPHSFLLTAACMRRSVHSDCFTGEVLPIFKNRLKIASETSFKNTVYHDRSGQMISVPPPTSYNHIDGPRERVPKSLKDECDTITERIFGRLACELHFEAHQTCWYVKIPFCSRSFVHY